MKESRVSASLGGDNMAAADSYAGAAAMMNPSVVKRRIRPVKAAARRRKGVFSVVGEETLGPRG
jgi:hypothetical protein